MEMNKQSVEGGKMNINEILGAIQVLGQLTASMPGTPIGDAAEKKLQELIAKL